MKNFIDKIFKFVPSHKLDIIFVALSLAMGVYFHWQVLEIAVFVLLIWVILNPMPSEYFAAFAMLLLILTPFFLIAEKEDIAEEIAIYAYYFLIFTVMMAAYEIRKSDNSVDETNL
jgi:hypothetical protein